MAETVRNLLRRKLRTALTVMGIMVGTLALTVMGSMSEKINLLVDGAAKFFNTRVIVQPEAGVPGQFLGPPLSLGVAEEIRALPGVDEAFAMLYLLYRERRDDTPSIGIGFPPLIVGVDARRFDYAGDRYPVVLSSGAFFKPGDRMAAVVGVDLSRAKDVGVGDKLTVLERQFDVVGIIERTLTARDNIVFMPIADAQELMALSLPAPLNESPYDIASEIEVHPVDLDRADEVAAAINDRVEGVRALPPGQVEEQFRQSLAIFNVIVIGSGTIAVVVGGFSILNTMLMAVSERTREIGVKKAVGASDMDIVWEFLRESAIMGLVGGILGLAAGAMLVLIINGITADQGVVIFAITARLSALVVVFAILLGIGAGLYPALLAARRDPAQALRSD
jgi:putative ABC transport system permease protein